MRFSENWLRLLANPGVDSAKLQHQLTMAGLEVEEVDEIAPPFSGVVVAEIISAQKHPNADKLRVCEVNAGQSAPLQIVCGAPNAAPGLKIPCALVGAKLPGGFEIKAAKLRGVESFGMLCSAKELGLSEASDGLFELPASAPVGQNIREYLDLDDAAITIKLTPNRADCLSITGIARELAAVFDIPLKPVAIEAVAASISDTRPVVLDAPKACPRYYGRVIRGVNAKALTPDWMRQRIERSGIRSVSALVDITNYVMLELGQPLHVFDNVKLSGAIHVRMPRSGEALVLLNGQTVKPAADTLLIADEEKVLAFAGLMGGEATGVTLDTVDVFLEAAFFQPDAIAGRARDYGLGSEASYRYERGVDFVLSKQAAERATALILEICAGQAGPLQEVSSPADLPVRKQIGLRVERVNQRLGVALSQTQMAQLLRQDHLNVIENPGQLLVTPPSWRFDIEIEEDLIEEIARLFGYDNIPVCPPKGALAMLSEPEGSQSRWRLRNGLAEQGFQELINFAFVDAAWERDFCANETPVKLANPIASHMSVMRSSLIPGLVNALRTNRKRQQARVRVFELGRVFSHQTAATEVPGYVQPMKLGLLASGSAFSAQWGVDARPFDFFDMKAQVERLLAHHAPCFTPTQHPALHPGRAAQVSVDGKVVGVLGEIHPRWVQNYELGSAPQVCELCLETVLELGVPSYRVLNRQPVAVRDLALVVDQSISADALLGVLRQAVSPIVVGIELFDLYQGKGLEQNKKSLAFKVLLQHSERTLEDNEIDEAIKTLIAYSEKMCAAQLRGETQGA